MDGEERTNSGRRRSVSFRLPQSRSALPQAQQPQHHAGFALQPPHQQQQQQQQPTLVVSAYEAAAAAAVYQARMLEQNRQLHLLVQERDQILLQKQREQLQQHQQEENQIQVLEKQVRQLQLQLNHELRKKNVVAEDTRRPRRSSVGERMRSGERRRSSCTGGRRQSSTTTTTRTENQHRLSSSNGMLYGTSLSKSMSSLEEAAAAAADAYETSDDEAEDYERRSRKAGARQEQRRIRRVSSSDCLTGERNRDRSPASHRRGSSLRPHPMPQRHRSQTNRCSSSNKKKKPEQRAGQMSSERRSSLGRSESFSKDPCADAEMGGNGEHCRRKATRRSSLQNKQHSDRQRSETCGRPVGDFLFRRKLRDGKILAARVVTAESGDPYMSHLIRETLQGGCGQQQVSTSSVFRIGEASRGLSTTVLAFSTDDAIDISNGVKRVVFHLKHVRGGTFTKEEFGDMRVSEVLDLSSVRPLVVDIMTEKC